MDFARTMKEKAKNLQRRIVLPEGSEERTITAAVELVRHRYAKEVTLLAARDAVVKNARGADLSGITIIDPETSEWLPEFAEEYHRIRKHKGMTLERAADEVRHFMRFGAMMVRLGKADALVSGALSPTADVLRAGLTIIGTLSDVRTASSCFIVDTHNEKWGVGGLLTFADCAVIPVPTGEQLCDIAVASAATFKSLVGAEPVVAMLSFSTKGSGGTHESVRRVQDGTRLARQKAPDLLLDGEFQADAALIPVITERKAPGSPIAGKVNTLVFPDLDAGNIACKLVQRLAGADAFGPFLQGLAKPISDLSRGCSVDEIIVTSCVTMVLSAE